MPKFPKTKVVREDHVKQNVSHKNSVIGAKQSKLSRFVSSLALRAGVSILVGSLLFFYMPEGRVIKHTITLPKKESSENYSDRNRNIIVVSGPGVDVKYLATDGIVNLEFFNYHEQVDLDAKRYGFEPSVIFAQIHKESGFNPKLVDYNKALGMMQVTPIALRELKRQYTRKLELELMLRKKIPLEKRKKLEQEYNTIKHIEKLPESHDSLTNPELNIHVGMQLLKYYYERRKLIGSKDPLLESLAEYNAGPNNINRISLGYAKKVLELAEKYSAVLVEYHK